MTAWAQTGRCCALALIMAAAGWLGVQPANAFCVRNDTGAPIRVEATSGTAAFAAEIANNTKTCCNPKDEDCAIGKADVQLSIEAMKGDAACTVTVDPKGNINVTGRQDALKCKANKAGSTMDWASG